MSSSRGGFVLAKLSKVFTDLARSVEVKNPLKQGTNWLAYKQL